MKVWQIVLTVLVAAVLAMGCGVGGWAIGHSAYDTGYTSGHEVGYNVGYTAGYDDGLAETAISEEVKLHLELMTISMEAEGLLDWAATAAAQRVLEELDDDALLDAWWAYQYCEWYQADYYWERFLDTWAGELRSYY